MRKRLFGTSFLLFTALATAQTPISDHLERDLRQHYEKKVVLVRHFYEGPLIRYDDTMQVVRAPEGSWTVTGYVQIKKVHVKDGAVFMEGERLAAIFDEKKKTMRLARYDEPVVIKFPIASDDDTRKKLFQIFVSKGDEAASLVPSYWRHYAETHDLTDPSKPFAESPKAPVPPTDVHRVGGEITPPRPIYKPEPSFTQFARRFRIQGQMGLVVTLNEKGEPQDISIVEPLGAGLDESAVAAIQKWRFEPSRKKDSGEPVKVRIQVDVDYRFYN
jgi:TonB family protein